MTVQFRRAEPIDEEFLLEMVRLAAGWRNGGRPTVTPAVAKYVEGFGRCGDHGIIAVATTGCVGAAWYRLFTGPSPAYGYVADDVPELAMAVLPHARRSGVATGLLERLLGDAAAQGLAAVSLSVEPDNPARTLYARLGFVKVGERDGAWTMLRALPL
jgi:GNAT superfamily N-acetyltransferase